MVQVRCPECGYLQTLSEERFLSISDDFLNCPHCHAKVPRHWDAEAGESVPEEVRHKMLAFSRRILNGGEVGREVVMALEALVRRYGAAAESHKALGIGYANVGEAKKAEEFLLQAREAAPDDLEILRCLLAVLLATKKFPEALDVGRTLLSLAATGADDQDVAGLALALIALDRRDEAERLMLSYPNLDGRNLLVKKARRGLNRGTGLGLAGVFGENGLLQRMLGRGWKQGREGSEDETCLATSGAEQVARVENRPVPIQGRGLGFAGRRSYTEKKEKLLSVFGFWVYAPVSTIPQWEEVKSVLGKQVSRKFDRARTLRLLESLIERNELTVDHIVKSEASELFDYPEDMIPANSRDLSPEDRNTLMNARMIVRLRLSLAGAQSVEPLALMIRLVEAVRSLSNGVVQDAVSHALWGTEAWRAYAQHPEDRLVESNIQVELLDEGASVWVHTHGMQKFGLPDLEIEDVPRELASTCRDLVVRIAERLIETGGRAWQTGSELAVPDVPFRFRFTLRPRDTEGHFPAGRLLVVPHVLDREPAQKVGMADVLNWLRSCPRAPQESPSQVGAPDTAVPQDETPADHLAALREQLLAAHRRAKDDLHLLRQSFQKSGESREHVHAVKVGFPAHDGRYEWMWVSLKAWSGNALVGSLENTPVLRKDLRKGSRVQISEGQIFDWVITREGRPVQGPYTDQIHA